MTKCLEVFIWLVKICLKRTGNKSFTSDCCIVALSWPHSDTEMQKVQSFKEQRKHETREKTATTQVFAGSWVTWSRFLEKDDAVDFFFSMYFWGVLICTHEGSRNKKTNTQYCHLNKVNKQYHGISLAKNTNITLDGVTCTAVTDESSPKWSNQDSGKKTPKNSNWTPNRGPLTEKISLTVSAWCTV